MILKGDIRDLPNSVTLLVGIFSGVMAVLHFYHEWKLSNGHDTSAD